jgi:hypothetical protein
MTTHCGLCKRTLRRPSPDGLGPKCRRKLHPPKPRATAAPVASAGQLDHEQLTAAGQLTIPENHMPDQPTPAHLPGCAAETYPDPGMCFCNKRRAFATEHNLDQDEADLIMEEQERNR